MDKARPAPATLAQLLAQWDGDVQEAIAALTNYGARVLYGLPERTTGMQAAMALRGALPKPFTQPATVTVYHATDQASARLLQRQGVVPLAKPWTQAARDFAAGKQATWAPGQGLSRCLYVGAHPRDVEGYGRVMLRVDVPESALQPSPEARSVGIAGARAALTTEHGAVVCSAPPSAFSLARD